MTCVKENKWDDLGGKNTITEIYNQPRLWRETLKIIKSNKKNIEKFLRKSFEKENLRIIFTGAGTSAYVGDTISPYISKKISKRVEAIATTDIVTSPEDYLEKDTPTILVSFARSGNSPESVATYNLAEKLIKDVKHIIITCNKDGQLAQKASKNEKNLILLMPEESDDKGFAMTSSFTCMTLAALLTFEINNIEENSKTVESIALHGENILKNEIEKIQEIVNLGYHRIVYLGSSTLKGLAEEGALKILELTHGKIVSKNESVLGFRHGPKSIINDKTLVFVFLSKNEYTRKYELDLLKEMYADPGEQKIIGISYNEDKELEKYTHYFFTISKENDYKADPYSALDYIIIAQLIAFFYSIKLNVTPDNPCPEGTVNRVVKGVNIYDYDL